jgi:hypothetical protein
MPQLDASSSLTVPEYPVGAPTPVTFGICALLLLLLRYLIFGFEVVASVRQTYEGTALIWSCVPKCCCRRSTGPQDPRPLRNWIRLIGSTGAYVLERLLRHIRFGRSQWTEWARLRNRIARNQVAVTWQTWQLWSTRLRRHPWHRDRKSVEAVGVPAVVQGRL